MKGFPDVDEKEREIHKLWNEQPREEHAMSIDEIRSRAERFERSMRRWNVATPILFVVIIVVEAWQVWRTPEVVERTGDLLTIAAFAYCLIRYREYLAAQPTSAGLGKTSSAEFYRKLLISQRDVASHPWRYLVFFVPGVALSLLGHAFDRPLVQTAMIAAAGVLLFLGVVWWHQHTARRLQREIDQLV